MLSPQKLIKMARKWQKLSSLRRRSITSSRSPHSIDEDNCSTSYTVDKGKFVVYSIDQRRFAIPLVYLKNEVFVELLVMAEEEYGLPRDEPITLPCDAVFLEYAISLIRTHAAKDVQKALLMLKSITSGCFSSSHIKQEQINQHLLICRC